MELKRLSGEIRAWRIKASLLIFFVMVSVVLAIISVAFAQSAAPATADTTSILSVLLEKAGFAAIAVYLIVFLTKMLEAMQSSTDKLEDALRNNTETLKQLKWHIERINHPNSHPPHGNARAGHRE